MNPFKERADLEQLKLLEMQMLINMKRLAIESPALLKASMRMSDRDIEMLKSINDVNIHKLITEGNNTSIIQAWNANLLEKLADDSLNLTEFELIADSIRS